MIDHRYAPRVAMHNKSELEKVNECACYHCLRIFNPKEIIEYTDRNSDTAVCPHCDVDAILPVYSDDDKDLETLSKIHKYWFQ